MNFLSYKWVYNIKYNTDGSIEHWKAHLILRGFGQLAGLDCNETFSLVVKPATIHIVFTLTVAHGLVIRQLDVTNAFLHGDLHDDIYMTYPQSFVHLVFPTQVCELNESLYELK